MSVFNFLKQAFNRITGSTIDGFINQNERRYFNRYTIHAPELILLRHPAKGSFKVLNLSYQGALIAPIKDETLSGLMLPADFDLCAFGNTVKFRVSRAEQRDGLWVIQFEHSGEGSIQNIGSFVEPVRCGSTAVQMPVDSSRTIVKDAVRVRYFGDGPFDILVEKKPSGEVTYFMATIRRGPDYGSVTWNSGQVTTQKTVDRDGVAARMAQTQETDKKLIWMCAMACLGLNFPEGHVCAHLLAPHAHQQ